MGKQSHPSIKNPDLFILAAEPSADLHGAALIEALLQKNPSLQIEGISGEKMRKLPIKTLYSAEHLSQIGLRGIFSKGFKTLTLFYTLLDHIQKTKPSILLLIDFPFFNLRFAKALRKRGYTGKIYQFICPKVWVWGKKRIEEIAKNFDELFTIFPFEKALFKKTPLSVSYVGNPLIEKYPHAVSFSEKIKTVGVFPGSRNSELKKHIPILKELLKEIEKKQKGLKFVFFAATSKQKELLGKEFPNCKIVSPDKQQKELLHIDIALAKSGTITLELALLGIPALVFYAASKLEEFWARKVLGVTIPHISLPNILLKEEVYKEILGKNLSTAALKKEFLALLEPKARSSQREKLHQLHALFGPTPTSSYLADLLFKRLSL